MYLAMDDLVLPTTVAAEAIVTALSEKKWKKNVDMFVNKTTVGCWPTPAKRYPSEFATEDRRSYTELFKNG